MREQKETIKDKRERFIELPLEFEQGVNVKDGLTFIISFALFFITLVCSFNFLALVCVVLSMALALSMLIKLVLFNKINVFSYASYGLLVFGTAFTFLCRGADTDLEMRLGYNLLVIVLALVAYIVVGISPKIKDGKIRFYLSRFGISLMIVGSLCYFLFMNIRLAPTVERMWDGHDGYLNDIESRKFDPKHNSNPNVLVILMDDMAFSDISSYSYMDPENATIKTPNIDSIGENGIMMENCYSSSPVSSPSRFGILTGRYSSRGYLDNVVFPTAQQVGPFGSTRFFNPFQFQHNVDGILGDEVTIAEAMRSAGYRTGLFGKWNLGDYGEYLPTNQGFEYFYGSHYVNDMTPYTIVEEHDGVVEQRFSHNELLDQSLSTERFTGAVNEYIDYAYNNDEKFFIEYWSPWPHFPIFSNKSQQDEGYTADDNYIDCIEEFDASLGTIFQNLKDKNLYDDTLIIFTSDNGPGREGVTGALRGRKNTPFEGAYKVPFLACYTGDENFGKNVPTNPDYDNNKVITSRCLNLDVFTTILDYAGIKDDEGNILVPTDRIIDGVSMRPLWEGTISEDTPMHSAIYYLKGGKIKAVSMPIETEYQHSKVEDGNIVDDPQTKVYDFKYYKSVQTENSAFFNQIYKNYLFNLDADQAEGYNIAMKYPDVVETLKNEFNNFEKSLKNNRRGIVRK